MLFLLPTKLHSRTYMSCLCPSFHPQVCWYQTGDSVMVRVKLLNPEDQSCHFYPDRVAYRSVVTCTVVLQRSKTVHVFSGRANGRRFRADLELQASIDPESCCWEMSCNEPVLKLVKQQQGYWERLCRNKVPTEGYTDANVGSNGPTLISNNLLMDHMTLVLLS